MRENCISAASCLTVPDKQGERFHFGRRQVSSSTSLVQPWVRLGSNKSREDFLGTASTGCQHRSVSLSSSKATVSRQRSTSSASWMDSVEPPTGVPTESLAPSLATHLRKTRFAGNYLAFPGPLARNVARRCRSAAGNRTSIIRPRLV
jgi:hypothetical protein